MDYIEWVGGQEAADKILEDLKKEPCPSCNGKGAIGGGHDVIGLAVCHMCGGSGKFYNV